MKTLRSMLGAVAYTLVTMSPDMRIARPKAARKTKAQAMKARRAKPATAKADAPTGMTHSPVANTSRMPGAKMSTATGGPGPMSPTNADGSFKGKPGEDIQLREPLAPAETRNAVAAAGIEKPETNTSRADADGMAAITPAVGDNFDVRAVPPAMVDQDNKKAMDGHRKAADKLRAANEKAARNR